MIAQREQEPRTRVTGVARFERFFRVAAGIQVDRQNLRRYQEFINHKIHDLLRRGEAAAKANGRDIIKPFDLPITKGLQESIHAFRNIDEDLELDPILERVLWEPPLDLAIGTDTEERLPAIARGIERYHGARVQDP